MAIGTVAWRDRSGTMPPKEALVHNFVLRLLAEVYDSLVEQSGTTDEFMRETSDFKAGDAG
jgi:7,8-dihydro-6-hydroxymethylpterin-pyrophosphokinase